MPSSSATSAARSDPLRVELGEDPVAHRVRDRAQHPRVVELGRRAMEPVLRTKWCETPKLRTNYLRNYYCALIVAHMTGYRELSKNHDFTVLWVGQTISELGTRVSMFVFPLVTYAVTGSALLAGVAGGLDLLGMAIALLPGGLLADRAHRGRVMRAASGAGVLLYASLVVAGVAGRAHRAAPVRGRRC